MRELKEILFHECEGCYKQSENYALFLGNNARLTCEWKARYATLLGCINEAGLLEEYEAYRRDAGKKKKGE